MKEQKIKSVLAATDFSAIANNAVMVAIDICKQHNAVLHLLHVVEKKYVVNVGEFGLNATVINNDDQEARSQLYNMYERILKEHEVMIRIHMPTGVAHDEICMAANELPVDLVVMGSHGMSGAKEFFIGSTAFKVIKHSGTSVITVPQATTLAGYKNILFPVRPVKGVVEKFRFIEPMLKPHSQVHIALLCEDESNEWMSDDAGLPEILMSLRNLCVPCSVDMYATSNPAAKVLELCDKLNADLLVTNASLDYNWPQFFSGSYTKQVVNHATIPVLSFRYENNEAELQAAKVQNAGIPYYH